MGKLYFFLNTLVGGKNKELLPENVSDARLANNFSAFFENKITDICAHIESNDEAISPGASRHLYYMSSTKGLTASSHRWSIRAT